MFQPMCFNWYTFMENNFRWIIFFDQCVLMDFFIWMEVWENYFKYYFSSSFLIQILLRRALAGDLSLFSSASYSESNLKGKLIISLSKRGLIQRSLFIKVDEQSGILKSKPNELVQTWNWVLGARLLSKEPFAPCGQFGNVKAEWNLRLSNWFYIFQPAGIEIWLGGIDIAREGNWVWASGATVKYSQWNPGEPNNGWGNQNCMPMYATGNWNDNGCPILLNSLNLFISSKCWS